eukprot:scaffold98767_cov32-Tisochrysis_lutea.AAC.6
MHRPSVKQLAHAQHPPPRACGRERAKFSMLAGLDFGQRGEGRDSHVLPDHKAHVWGASVGPSASSA